MSFSKRYNPPNDVRVPQRKMIEDVESRMAESKGTLQTLRDQFSKTLVEEFIADPRTVYQRTVYCSVKSKDRIEMWLRSINKLVLWFNPEKPRFLFYLHSSWGEVSIDLSYAKITLLYEDLKNGEELFEALKMWRFVAG